MKLIKNYEEESKSLLEDQYLLVYNRRARVKRSLKRLMEFIKQGNPKARTLFKNYVKIRDLEAPKLRTASIILLPYMVGKTLKVYNGKTYQTVKILEEAIGRYLGEFITTRTHGPHIRSKDKDSKGTKAFKHSKKS